MNDRIELARRCTHELEALSGRVLEFDNELDAGTRGIVVRMLDVSRICMAALDGDGLAPLVEQFRGRTEGGQ